MGHLYWYKPQVIVLGLKVVGLPDSHLSKPKSLTRLPQLFDSIEHKEEHKNSSLML